MPAINFNRLTFGTILLLDETQSTLSTVVQDINGTPSGSDISIADAWQVQFDWTIGGALAVLASGSFDLEVSTHYNGAKLVLGSLSVLASTGAWDPVAKTRSFTALIPVAANTITNGDVYSIEKRLVYTAPVATFRSTAFVPGEQINFF
jgi:hypothetical protein